MQDEADEQRDGQCERVVCSIAKGERTEIRGVIRAYKGKELVELRTYCKRPDGTWTHTARGVSVLRERADELLAAAQALAAAARGEGS